MTKGVLSHVGMTACAVVVASSGQAQERLSLDSLLVEAGGFIENAGQWVTPARFVARTEDFLLGVGGDHLDFLTQRACEDRLEQQLVRLVFVGADEHAVVEGQEVLPGTHSFFRDRDPSAWVTGAKAYSSVRVSDLYPGIDLLVKRHPAGMEYDLILSPGADLDDVVIRCDGGEGLWTGEDQALHLRTEVGPIVQRSPVTWIELGDERRPVECRYRVLSRNEYGFAAPGWGSVARLVVDPVLEWSSYLGGSSGDEIQDVAVDGDGTITVVGSTNRFFGLTFPVVPGSLVTTSFNLDAFATRIDPSGPTLLYSAVFGSLDDDRATSVALGRSGEAFITGNAGASDFPVTGGALDTTFGGLFLDGFLLRLTLDGSGLIYSTFLGGSASDGFNMHVSVDRQGVATVVGDTASTDVATTPGAFQGSYGGGPSDVFVTQVTPNGSAALFSTYFGGSSYEYVEGAVVTTGGDIVLAGSTVSTDFPTTPGAFAGTHSNPGSSLDDVYVSRLSSDGSTLVASTYLGGLGFDFAQGVSALPGGDMVVVGRTSSADFPVTRGVLDPVFAGPASVFVTRVDGSAQTLDYSTFLGAVATPFTLCMDVIADASGVATITGGGGNGFPVTPGSYDAIGSQAEDGFVSRLDPDGERLLYSTYLTGRAGSLGCGLAERSDGMIVFAGDTSSGSYPTTPDATQGTYGGGSDGVVTALDLLPAGVTRRRGGTASCLGPVRIGVLRVPEAGVPGFGFWSSQAPPNGSGALLIGSKRTVGAPLLDFPFSAPLLGGSLPSLTANADGWAEQAVVLPPGSEGTTFDARFVWVSPPGCGTPGGFVVSDELRVTVQ